MIRTVILPLAAVSALPAAANADAVRVIRRGDFRGWRPALRGYDVLRFVCHAAEDGATVLFM